MAVCQKLKKIQNVKWNHALFAAWAIPGGIMLLLFIINGIYPFGDRSFLFSDMYHQYMPFFSEFMEKVKAGEPLYYSWNVGMGSNFLALYVYYLASPLHWLAFLFPQSHLMEFMSYLVIVKVGLCGLTFCYYLRKHFQTEAVTTVMFAVFYALSGYMAAYNWNIMWLDCVILFPLIIWGLERLVKEGKPIFYCIMLALCIFSNFYISIMICIFLVLYFVALIFTNERYLKPCLQFALYSLLAGALAAILLVPEVCAILATDFGAMEFPKEVRSYFSVLDELARHQMCVTTERQLDHWPNIYCGVAVMMLVPLFAICDKISIKRRFAMLGLTIVLLFSFSTNILDFIWHGLNYPDSLPARQSFIYIFLVLVMSFEAFSHVREMNKQKILYCFLGAVIFLLFCEKFVEDTDIGLGLEILSMAFLAVYAMVIYYYHCQRERDWQRVLCIVGFLLISVEAGINTYTTSIGTVSRESYFKPIRDYENLYEYAKENTKGFYRLEIFDRRTKNDAILAGYPSASLFSSTMNSSVANFYKMVGMRHSKVYYAFDGATALTSAMLNVNYMYGATEKGLQYEASEKEDRLYTSVGESGDITLYQCNYTLPFGYVVPLDFEMPDSKVGNPLKIQNEMIHRLGIKENLFTRANVKKEADDSILVADRDAYYYVVNGKGNTKIDVSGDFDTKNIKDLKNDSVIYIGYLEQGNKVRLENGDEEDDTQTLNLVAYRMDLDVLKDALELLSMQHMVDVSYDSNHIRGHISLENAGKVLLSVPYEEGWTARVDGEIVETGLYGECFMTISLEPGDYEIDLVYDPQGRKEGIIITICGWILFITLLLVKRKSKLSQNPGELDEKIISNEELE